MPLGWISSLLPHRSRAVVTMILAAMFVLLNCFGGIHNDPRTRYKYVETENGKIRGHLASDGDYLAFQGIPYAAPPVGEDRFKAPKPREPWNGIFDASRIVKCPQKHEGEEDCLVVNIFTPTKSLSKLLPVLVYIHGGAFIFGFGPTDGVEPLIQKDIIVVTLNYRLGALGFLCLGITDAPGNAGLKDQVAALKWVKLNIALFGGDPNQVTIYGMSAGGASVEYLILSEMAKGLFRTAIIESGSSTPVWASDINPIATAVDVAKRLNFPMDKPLKGLVYHYKNISAKALSVATNDHYKNLTDGTFGFVPCVEKQINGVKPFIDRSPHDILAAQDFDSVPVIFLFVTLEGLFLRSQEYYEQNYKDRMEHHFDEFMPADIMFDNDVDKNKTTHNVKHFYFGTNPIGDDVIVDYLSYFGDYMIMHSLLGSVLAHTKNSNPVYLMEFAYKGNMGQYDQFYECINMAGHGDAVKHVIVNAAILTDMDKLTVERMTTLIANFVKVGHPTPSRTNSTPIMWQPIHPSQKLSFLYLKNDFDIVFDHPYALRKEFWDTLYNMYRRPVHAVNPDTYSLLNGTNPKYIYID